MELIHRARVGAACLLLLWTITARSEEPATCTPAFLLKLDLSAWRQQLLKTGNNPSEFESVLELVGFNPRDIGCLPTGKIVAVDIFSATFGAKPDADRIVQVRTQNCVLARDLIVLTAQADASWCRVHGDLDLGKGSQCGAEPFILQLLHLTDPLHHTIRMTYSDNSLATVFKGKTYERICDKHRNTSYWDVQDNVFVFRLRTDSGPMGLSGHHPKTLRTKLDRHMTTFHFDGTMYRPEE